MPTIPKRIILIDGIFFENWDYRNPDTQGIGNSETCQIELAQRLARRGWEVISYAPIPEDCERFHNGVEWRHVKDLDTAIPGFWFIFRQPDLLDKFVPLTDQWLSVLCQDMDYPSWNPVRAAKLNQVIALCQMHKQHLEANHPELRGKVMVSSNAIRPDLWRSTMKDPPARNPRRLMWASSPDRGLLRLAKIFRRVVEWVPDAELHCFYGFDNIDKMIDRHPGMRRMKEAIMNELQQPGIVWHGRASQPELYTEWAKTGIFCYPTTFTETSCATVMEAQALGAIPITSPVWALAENTWHGCLIEGDPEDPLVSARFVGEIVKLMQHPEIQDQIRPKMMAEMVVSKNWERVCDQWEAMFLDFPPDAPRTHYMFQLKNATGKILNIGCDEDPCKFGERGATNVDITDTNPVLHYKTAAHVIADVRKPLPLGRDYDTVILGDVIEHINEEEVPGAIFNAAACVKPGGKLLVGFPDDTRTIEQQALWHNANGTEHYGPNSHALHTHRMDVEWVKRIITGMGLSIEKEETIDYGLYVGYGLLCRVQKPWVVKCQHCGTNLERSHLADSMVTGIQCDACHRLIELSPEDLENMALYLKGTVSASRSMLECK